MLLDELAERDGIPVDVPSLGRIVVMGHGIHDGEGFGPRLVRCQSPMFTEHEPPRATLEPVLSDIEFPT